MPIRIMRSMIAMFMHMIMLTMVNSIMYPIMMTILVMTIVAHAYYYACYYYAQCAQSDNAGHNAHYDYSAYYCLRL